MDSTRARERQGEQGRARAGAGSGRGANLPQQWRCGGRVGGAPERAERCSRWTCWEGHDAAAGRSAVCVPVQVARVARSWVNGAVAAAVARVSMGRSVLQRVCNKPPTT